MRQNLRLLQAPPSHLEHQSPFTPTTEEAWQLTQEIENHDPWMNWGDLLRFQIAAAPATDRVHAEAQFVQFDLPRPAVVQLRLSAICAQAPFVAPSTLTADWQITIGVGRAAQVRHVPQVVQPTSSNADLVFQFPARTVLIACSVTSHLIAVPVDVVVCAQAAPFYSGADVGVVPTGQTR